MKLLFTKKREKEKAKEKKFSKFIWCRTKEMPL